MKKIFLLTLGVLLLFVIPSCKKEQKISEPSETSNEYILDDNISESDSTDALTRTTDPTPTIAAPISTEKPTEVNETDKVDVTEFPKPVTTSAPGEASTCIPATPTETIFATCTPSPVVTLTPSPTTTFTPTPIETVTPAAFQNDYTAKEYTSGNTKIIEDIVYERKNPVKSVIEVEDGNSITVVPDNETGYYYTTLTSFLSDEVTCYLKKQTSSNSLSRIHSPQRIIGRGYLAGTPFIYVPLINSSVNKRGDYDKVVIGEVDYSKGKILSACYSYPKKAALKVSGIEKNKLYLEAVYLDISIDSLDSNQSVCPEDMIIKKEKHLDIVVTRPVSDDYRSDYIFLAYPLLNGKYVINCGGGIIVLNGCPQKSLDIRFSAGGGVAGFCNFQIFVDEKKIFECDRFCVNSYEGDCNCYDPYIE